jgi:hypothetical protein
VSTVADSQATPNAEDLAGSIGALVNGVCVHLDHLARLVQASRRAAGGRPLREGDLTSVRDEIVSTLPGPQDYIGLGFAAAPEVMLDEPLYLLWWQRRGDQMGRLRLNLDPRHVDVYDYQTMDWFRLARDENRRVAFGPYVDYSGSDEVTITVSLPVIVDGAFVGVVGADLAYAEVERRWIEVLRSSAVDGVLVNSERRVVTTNSTRWVVSQRLPELPAVGSGPFTDVAMVPDGTGWVVALANS